GFPANLQIAQVVAEGDLGHRQQCDGHRDQAGKQGDDDKHARQKTDNHEQAKNATPDNGSHEQDAGRRRKKGDEPAFLSRCHANLLRYCSYQPGAPATVWSRSASGLVADHATLANTSETWTERADQAGTKLPNIAVPNPMARPHRSAWPGTMKA